MAKDAYPSDSFMSMKQKILRLLRDSTPLIGLVITSPFYSMRVFFD